MKHTAIVGTGPIGQYIAYKLYKAGVRNLILIDPRNGEYVRPGHVNRENFVKLELALKKTEFSTRFGHIKDFERTLFREITALNIPAEKKFFVRFQEDDKNKGIIVKDAEGNEELIECDFVFDCTGSQRVLVNTINKLVTPAPFTIKPIHENVAIRQNLLAYVQMTEADLSKVSSISNMNRTAYFLTAEQQVNAVNRMRALGWKDFSLPQLYGAYFGKDKCCLYMECPDNLPTADYELWVKIALDVCSNTSDITFRQLTPSRKYASKPRLMSYIVDPRELVEAGFKGKNLPIIIPMGDSQTEPHPSLAQGIADGLDRVDAFIEHIEVYNGGIAYCEVDDYKLAINKLMAKHKDAIKVKYQSRERTSFEMLLLAQINYATVLAKATEEADIAYLTEVLNEIKARFAYHEAITLRASLLIENKEELSTLKNTPEELRVKLKSLTEFLSYAYEHIPFNFALEKESVSLMLKQTAGYLKECGTRFIKTGDNAKALITYQEALKLYHHPSLASLQLEKITIQSNLVITYRKLGLHDEAVYHGIAALEWAPKSAEFAEIRKKILYNTLKSLQTLMQSCSADKELERSFHRYRALELMDKNPNLLEKSPYNEFCIIYGKKINLEEASTAATVLSSPLTFLGKGTKAVIDTALSLGSQFNFRMPFF